MNKHTILALLFSILFFSGYGQNSCSVYYEPVEISNSTFNGTVIIDPKGPINIHVNYVSPTEDAKSKMEVFAYLLGLQDDEEFKALSEEEKEAFIRKKVQVFKDQQQVLKEQKQGIALEKEKLENVKQELRNTLQSQRKELTQMVDQAKKQNLSQALEKQLSEQETQINQIITSAEDCLLNDHEPVPIKDVKTGEIVIGFSLEAIKRDPNYVIIDDYSEGLARVKRNNKYGFYDTKGELVIPFKYDYAEAFEDGKAFVKNLNQWFFINHEDEKVLDFPKEYQHLNEIKRVLPRVYNCALGSRPYFLHLDKQNQFLKIRAIDEFSTFGVAKFYVGNRYDDKIGIINKQGQIVEPAEFDKVTPSPFNPSFYVVQKDYKFGMLNERGQLIIPAIYHKIEDWENKKYAKHQLVLFEFEGFNKKDLYDYTGKLIISHEDYLSFSLTENLIEVRCDKKWGVVNLKGETVLPCTYDFLKYNKYQGQFIVRSKNNVGVIDTSGNVIIPLKYSDVSLFNNSHYEVKDKKEKRGIFFSGGDVIVPIAYSQLEKMDFLIRAQQEQQFTYYDFNGDIKLPAQGEALNLYRANIDKGIILPVDDDKYWRKYGKDVLYFLSRGSCSNCALYGMKDQSGKFSLLHEDMDFNYDQIRHLGKGVYFIGNDYLSYQQGRILYGSSLSKEYYNVKSLDDWLVDKNGHVIVNGATEKSYGSSPISFILNKKLEKISKAYSKISPCENGMYLVEIKKTDRPGFYTVKDYLDNTGKRITNREFEYAKPFDSSQTAIVGNSEEKYGVIDPYGAEIVVLHFEKVTRIKDGFLLNYKENIQFKVDQQGKCIGTNCKQYNEIIQAYHAED